VLSFPYVRDISSASGAWRGRDLLRYGEEPMGGIRLVRLRARWEADTAQGLRQDQAGDAFRIITKKAGLGEDWTPRELRHTFVSVMSANGVPVENIAQLVGHDRTATTESVYRHEIRPALTQGAEVMDKIFA
jgi:integrase